MTIPEGGPGSRGIMAMSERIKALFVESHGDLLTAAYWRSVQETLERGGAPPFSPYAGA